VSLLVVPFSYVGDRKWQYLGRGIAEEIATRLTPLSGTSVYGPGSMPEDGGEAVRTVAARLGVHYVLEGQILVEAIADSAVVHVTTSLVAVDDGRTLWSWMTNRRLDGMMQLQIGIADSATKWLSLTLSPEGRREVLRAPTANPEAYDYYLRAEDYLRRGRDGLPEARELLRAAVALDSGFALALARLAETQARMNWYGYDRSADAMRESRRLITRSMGSDRQRAEPHTAMAWWLLAERRAYRDAYAELDTALRFAPHNADVIVTQANIARRIGNWQSSASLYREALRLDPSSYATSLELGNTLLLMRRFGEAREALERARQLAPDAVDPPVWLAALAVRERGDTAEARRIIQRAIPLVDGHYLVARSAQSFPELLRVLPASIWPPVTEILLRHAYGDTALMHALRAVRRPDPAGKRAQLDSAAAVLQRRLALEPDAFAAWRALAEVRLAEGLVDDGLTAAQRSALLMPASADAFSAVHSQIVLAQAELQSGRVADARSRVARLLRVPSPLTEALVRLDPLWRGLQTVQAGRRPQALD
jgi:TolB-like protein/tetratricopeptide (TPR) repeat protein